MLTVEVPDTAAISELGQEGLEDIEEPPDRNKRQIEGGDSEPKHRGNETVSQWLLVRGSLRIEGATMY